MPDFDTTTAMSVVEPTTVVVAVVVGAVCGFLFLDKRPSRAVVWLTVGVSFLASMMATRYIGGSEVWEGWIGVIVLWVVFSLSATVVGYFTEEHE